MKRKRTILRTLTRRSLKANRTRNTVAVLAIILTAMMFTTLLTLTQSMGKNLTEMYLRQAGTTAHASTKQITDAQIEKIAAHPAVVSYGRDILVGLAENKRLAGQQVEIRYGDKQSAKDSFAYPTTGHMPQKADEIALDTLVIKRLGIPLKLGEQVTLEWRKDLNLEQTTSSTFTLCGWWQGNASMYASMAWVSEDFALSACGNVESPKPGQICGQRTLAVNLSSDKSIDETMAKILEDCNLTDIQFQTNLTYTAETKAAILGENLPVYVGMLLVAVAGFLIIFNIFQISVVADIQFYGRQKTLGMTKKQIRHMIYGQANRLSLIAIPVGLLIGYLLGVVLVPVMLSTLGAKPTASVNPLIFIGAALFTWFTVIVSCMLPARLAGRVSPVEALRYCDSGGEVRRKSKKTKRGTLLVNMAWSNLGRNRKRTVVVICSLTLGLVLMSFFYAKNASFDVEKYLMDMSVADFQIDDASNASPAGYDTASDTISEELLSDISDLKNIEKTGRLYSCEVELPLSDQVRSNLADYYTKARLDDFASYDPQFSKWKEKFDRAVAGDEVPSTVYGADGLILDAAASSGYILDGVFDAGKFSSGQYALAIGPAVEPGTGLPTYSVGETVNIKGREFTLMAILSPLQPMVEGTSGLSFDLPLVISADAFQQLWPDSNLRKYYFNVSDKMIEKSQDLLEQYQQTMAQGMNITSRQTMVDQYQSQTRASAVMGYTVSIVIALVGVLNFVNSMVTAIVSRKKEFAMIQSIGMTKRQLRKMLVFEGLDYAALTLAASYILSTIVVGVIVRGVVDGGFSTFHFTLLPLVVCTPVLIILAVVIPYLCFKNLEKQSVVERLRMAE